MQRGEAPFASGQIPNPKSQEGAGTRPCRGFGGVPQISFFFPQEWGTKGVDDKSRGSRATAMTGLAIGGFCYTYIWIPASAGMTGRAACFALLYPARNGYEARQVRMGTNSWEGGV